MPNRSPVRVAPAPGAVAPKTPPPLKPRISAAAAESDGSDAEPKPPPKKIMAGSGAFPVLVGKRKAKSQKSQ
jgi:hypothetical protein